MCYLSTSKLPSNDKAILIIEGTFFFNQFKHMYLEKKLYPTFRIQVILYVDRLYGRIMCLIYVSNTFLINLIYFHE